jgi:hypothetical protein
MIDVTFDVIDLVAGRGQRTARYPGRREEE